MNTEYIPDIARVGSGPLVSCWGRRIETPVGGACAQAFLRLGGSTLALGWVTRWRCVPKFFFLRRCKNQTSRAVELHIWRARLGVKWAANVAVRDAEDRP